MATKAKRGTFTYRRGPRSVSFSYSEESDAEAARDYRVMAAWLRETADMLDAIAGKEEMGS